jgi:hypothetical protein
MSKPNAIQNLRSNNDDFRNDPSEETNEFNCLQTQTGNNSKLISTDEIVPDLAIYKNIFNAVTEAIYILNDKWEFLEVNRGAELMYGHSRAELLGKTPLDVSAPDKNDIEKVVNDLQYVLKNGGTRKFEFWGIRKNNEQFLKEVIINKGYTNNQDVIIASARDITEQRRSEDEKNRIFTFSVDMICTAGLNDGFLKQINPAWEKTLGWSHEELSHKPFIEFIHPDDRENTIKAATRMTEGKPALGFENRYQAKDGTYKWLSWNTIPIPEENIMLGIARDITEQKQTAALIQQSEEKFRALYDNAPLAYQSLDIDGRFIDINPTWCSVLGYEREEVIGQYYSDFLHPDWKPHFKTNFPEFKARGYVKDVQFKLKHKKGHFIDVSFEGCIGYYPDGSFRQTYCVFKDITVEKKAQQDLINSEARFKRLFVNANTAMVIANKKTEILEANNEFVKLLGYSNDELLHLNFRDFTYPEDLPSEIELVEKLFSGKIDNYRIEKRFIHKNGDIIWGDTAIAVVKNLDGEIDLFITMTMDITRSKMAELELIKAKERAEEADRLKSAFLANMSHEIRTPMNGILGFAELLEQPNLSKEEQYQYLSIIKRSGDRMLNTVNDIIDISKIDAGQVKLEKRLVNIKEEVNSIYLFFKPEALKRGLSFSLHTNRPDSDFFIKTDRPKFNSILINLIKNAIKYTDKGSIEIKIIYSNSILRCEVKDTGIGIHPNRLNAIFNRFEQADIADSSAREGSGLGLAIAQSYVEMLDGEINVKSVHGVGSEFSFQIPVARIS